MPRKPARGLRWVSIEVDDDTYQILKGAAAKDRRSLSMFLRIELGELASNLELKANASGVTLKPKPEAEKP